MRQFGVELAWSSSQLTFATSSAPPKCASTADAHLRPLETPGASLQALRRQRDARSGHSPSPPFRRLLTNEAPDLIARLVNEADGLMDVVEVVARRGPHLIGDCVVNLHCRKISDCRDG
jgi:hypothetical protein